MIPTLIDRQDNFEVIRDQIAGILLTESASQIALAKAAAKDPDPWKLQIYSERSNPWEIFLNEPVKDKSPIVNIWFDNDTFDPKASNVSERQKSEGVFNIDCYGYGHGRNNPAGGHIAGDQDAAIETHRALRLVRSILMASEYTYLGLRGLVWGRWPRSRTVFQPEQGQTTVQPIVGARLALAVGYSEFAPQAVEETLEYVAIDVRRTEDGEIVLEADYDYTLV